MCVCLCDSECVAVLGAGAKTLCSEHVLMNTAVQYPAIPLFLLQTNTQDDNSMLQLLHGSKVGSAKVYYHALIEGAVRIYNNHGQSRQLP